jgi:signal peptidase II
MRLGRRAWIVFGLVLAITCAFDQGSKAWARTLPVHPASCAIPGDLIAHTCGGVPQTVIPGYWDWELAMNPGAAFSSFVGGAGLQLLLALIATVALVGIGVMASRTRPEQRLKRFGFAMIAGGALGNLIDRIRDGAVTDFIRWHWHEHRWPIFNVADAALLVGVVLLLVESALDHQRERRLRLAT